LKQSCLNKISEAEERYQYAQLYLPKTMEDTKAELGYASEDYNNGDFELCLFKASKVKAEADVILGVIGVAEEQMDVVLENKLDAVKRVIAEQQEKGIFPMLGYSYYEYAVNLKKEDQLSALLYAEYSLELSNLDIYFSKRQFNFIGAVDIEKLTIFAAGIALGIVAVLLVRGRLKGKKKSSAKKRRK
jgi:predicted S18 family serine protease